MKKIKSKLCAWVLTAGSLAISAGAASAQNANYAPGDLVLFFQKEGSTNTLYANLGASTTYRGSATGPDVANILNIININTQLNDAFGASWASDTSLYAGIAGVWGFSSGDLGLDNGDPQRTLYVSASRAAVGTIGAADSSGYNVGSSTDMTGAATAIFAMNDVLETQYTDRSVVSPTSVSRIDDYKKWPSPSLAGVCSSEAQQESSPPALEKRDPQSLLSICSVSKLEPLFKVKLALAKLLV
jgi:hypothetical protein